MSFSMSTEWIVFLLFFLERWPICYCVMLLFFGGTRISLVPKWFKRMVLSLFIFNDQPFLETIALKLFNPEYSEVKDSFGKPFCCKCGEQPGVPGVRPTPSDQGQSETCTLHAISKAIVSFLDKRNIDADQDQIEDVLLDCIGTKDRQWPSSFSEKVIDDGGDETEAVHRSCGVNKSDSK